MRVKIREQLSLLVALTTVIAVGVLAVVTWVNNYRLVLDVRSSRFSLTASLKSGQVSQAVTILHNTAVTISTRAILQAALRRYRLQGNNTVENWARVREDLKAAASISAGGLSNVLQLVVYDEFLSSGDPTADNGTVIDGTVVGGDGYNGTLPNGTALDVGPGLGGTLGLLNITGENVRGIVLPGSAANGWMDTPMDVDTSDPTFTAGLEKNTSAGLPYLNPFPVTLYPTKPSSANVVVDNETTFSPGFIERNSGLILGPLRINDTFYIISLTVPIINNTSQSDLLGFITIVLDATSILDIVRDTRGLGRTGETILVGPASANNLWNDTRLIPSYKSQKIRKRSEPGLEDVEFPSLIKWLRQKRSIDKRPKVKSDLSDYEFRYILPPARNPALAGETRRLEQYEAVKRVFEHGVGGIDNTGHEGDGGGNDLTAHNSEGKEVSVGYAIPNITSGLANWALLIEQDRKEAFQPIDKLRKILLATVFGTFAVVVALVCPIAHFAVRPIARLKTATEKTTRPPSYTPEGSPDLSPPPHRHCGACSDDESHDYQDHIAQAEKGRNKIHIIINRFKKRAQNLPGDNDDDDDDSASNESRRRAFRIPGKVRERRHIIHDELTDLTRTFNEMSEELVKQYENLEERVAERTKELEEQKKLAEAANEAKSLFIANITHELRTPLNGILGMCAVCMQEDDMPRIKRSLGIVYKSGELLLHLLTDLLTFSKNQVGHMAISLDEREFKIMDISTQILAIFETQAQDSKIDLAVSVSPEKKVGNMVFWGDSNRILQVLINLVSNSLKFTPENGAVQVRMNLVEEIVEMDKPRRGNSRTGSKADSSVKHARGFFSKGSINKSSSPGPSVSHAPNTTPNTLEPIYSAERLHPHILGVDRPATPAYYKTYMFEFQVEDTGPGIPEHLHQQVFEPFVQGDLRLSKKYGGTGLGLSICQQLAKLMRGTIELKSLEQAGTTFTMRIPLKYVKDATSSIMSKDPLSRSNSLSGKDNGSQRSVKSGDSGVNGEFGRNNKPRLLGLSQPFFAPPPPAETPKEELKAMQMAARFQPKKDGEKIRVLVAEDNKVNQEVVLRMLKLEEIYDVTLAKDGQEAVDQIKEALKQGKTFHLVLMDIQMPNLDGLESTRIIRNLGYSAPIVALTAFAEESNVKDCLEAGMDYFLAKPIKRPQLKKVIRTYCQTIKEEGELSSKSKISEKTAPPTVMNSPRQSSPILAGIPSPPRSINGDP